MVRTGNAHARKTRKGRQLCSEKSEQLDTDTNRFLVKNYCDLIYNMIPFGSRRGFSERFFRFPPSGGHLVLWGTPLCDVISPLSLDLEIPFRYPHFRGIPFFLWRHCDPSLTSDVMHINEGASGINYLLNRARFSAYYTTTSFVYKKM